MDGEKWVGRGFDEVPGKPADWAWQRERQEIRRHIHAKLDHRYVSVGAKRFWQTHRGRGVDWAIDRLQQRIHRKHPKMIEKLRLQALERAALAARFSVDELRHMAEHFAGANDPLGQAILDKVGAFALDTTGDHQ